MKILILGAGYVGRRVADTLREAGHTVWTVRRTPQPDDPFAIAGDLTRPESIHLPGPVDRVVYCAGLQGAALEDYRSLFVEGFSRVVSWVKTQGTIDRMLFTSTTGIYSVVDGRWVNETTEPNPVREVARCYREAEQLLGGSGLAHIVVRLSGIYGPERCRWIRLVREGQARRLPGSPRFMNHIHVEDAARAIVHLLHHPEPDSLYIASDHQPVDRNELITFLAETMHLPTPPFLPDDASPPLGRGGNKRCDSTKLRESGFSFRFPTYREGYTPLIRL